MNNKWGMLVAVQLVMYQPYTMASCGSAACTMNTSWDTQAVWTEPGIRFDVRYEFIEQDKLRDGNNVKILPGPPGTHDESRTINRGIIFGVDYSWHPEWGVNVQLPYYNRYHVNADYPATPPPASVAAASVKQLAGSDSVAGTDQILPAGHLVVVGPNGRRQTWHYRGIGDLRVQLRHQLEVTETGARGITFGMKFPTAPRKVKGTDGLDVDRSVNPGTGSWDLLLGMYQNRRLSKVSSGFANIGAQIPVADDGDYHPGAVLSLDLGYRRAFDNYISFIPQLNIQLRDRDGGREGLPGNSGGLFVNLSPGISYEVGKNSQIYLFAQLPVYRHLSGPQVTPDWSAAAGISMRF